jgi:NAD(P)H-hydrate epimerase
MGQDSKVNLPRIPHRPEGGHKGTFGTVCVLGGQCAPPRVMIGGPALAALGALRSGCGLAVLAMPEPILPFGLTIAPSATGLALPVDSNNRLKPSACAELIDENFHSYACLAIGPGLGADAPQQQIVVRLVAQPDVPLVVDADALNCLARLHDFRGDFRAHAVVTPHPGEFARLAEHLGITRDATDDKQRRDAASELAQRLGCVVVLKGPHTVVSNGMESWINTAGNVSLATAGTGDVLTGIIAGLIAQFHKPHLGTGGRQITPEQQGGLSLYDCARIGVHLHAKAAEKWAESKGVAGLLALDLIENLPAVIREYREDRGG